MSEQNTNEQNVEPEHIILIDDVTGQPYRLGISNEHMYFEEEVLNV